MKPWRKFYLTCVEFARQGFENWARGGDRVNRNADLKMQRKKYRHEKSRFRTMAETGF